MRRTQAHYAKCAACLTWSVCATWCMAFIMKNDDTRSLFFDNLKAVLILLVVLGHTIEPILTGKMKIIYLFIYSFHMPLFAFCSGYFSKFDPGKILKDLIYPFVVFQILYCLFEKFYLGNPYATIQFTTPYWIMWYLFALVVWTLILPVIEPGTNSNKGILIITCISLALGIISGFDKTLGYYMSLSRIFYFLPFFITGFCIRKVIDTETFQSIASKRYIRYISGALSVLVIVGISLNYQQIDVRWLYGSFTYELEGYTIFIRLLSYLTAFSISIFLMSVAPKRKRFYTYIGQRSLQIYLLHGFLMRLILKMNIYNYVQNQYFRLLLSCAISIIIVIILSSGLIKRILNPLFSIRCLDQNYRKIPPSP